MSARIELNRISYLIAGGSGHMRSVLLRALRNFSAVDVREAPNLNTAIEMSRARRPGMVLLGLGASPAEELDFLRRINGNQTRSHIPIVVVSGATEIDVVAMELGANSLIHMPFSIAAIEAHLLKALSCNSSEQLRSRGEIADISSASV